MDKQSLCECEVVELDKKGRCKKCQGYRRANLECICFCYRDENDVRLNLVRTKNPSCKVVHH